MRRHLLLVSALATALLVTPTGCAKKDASSSTSVSAAAFPAPLAAANTGKKILNYGNGAEPQDLDFQIVTGVPEHRLALTFFEGLVSEDPQLNIMPGVAERWDISPDGLRYTFHLRADAQWSNGDPVTADDFVQSYQRMITPALGAEYSYMLWHVVGAEDYNKSKLTDFSKTGFNAVDPRTLQLTLRQATPFLLHAMNHYAWFPLHIPTLKKFGALDRKSTPWSRPENFVGNGPYLLKEWRPNQKIVATRSPTYWDRSAVKIDEIHFFPVELADTEERMFRTGQLHITNEVPLTKLAVYQREQPDSVRVDPYNGIYFYRFNVQRKPFDDVRVRRALALAIDRETLVKKVTLAGELPAYDFTPPDLIGYVSRHRFQADLAEAKRLLAAAGFTRAEFAAPSAQEVQTSWGRFAKAWEVLQDDLNIPGCLGQVFTVLAEKDEPSAEQARQDISGLAKILFALGLELFVAKAEVAIPADVADLGARRWAAKQSKDFAAADQLRQDLAAIGWTMLDRKDGYELKKA